MRILSGIQPSGKLHLGNYFGMVKPALALQEQGEAFYFIADYHALTSVRAAKQLRENVQELAVDLLACGLDPERAVFFRQSDVPEVLELMWILSTLTPMGLLERAHSYKDKIAKGMPPHHGLFSYPVLMAADILLYDSDLVPVGKDQKQHLEMTRDLAQKFNDAYGSETLKLPKPQIQEQTATVLGTDGQKMSKSYDNTLGVFEEEKPLRKKIMRLVTDSTPVEEPKDTENSTILSLYELVASPEQVAQMKADFQAGGIGYGAFKQQLFEATWEYFRPVRERKTVLIKDPNAIEQTLLQGAEKARAAAQTTLQRIRKAVGLA